MGGIANAIFGTPTQSYDMPQTTAAPLPEESRDPEAKAVRDTERRRLMSRRAMSGTLLTGQASTQPGGILGRNGS